MMKHEFEAIAGYKVSVSDYDNIIEPMYMATELSKAEFVKVISKERFALKSRDELIQEIKGTAEHLKQTCEHFNKKMVCFMERNEETGAAGPIRKAGIYWNHGAQRW